MISSDSREGSAQPESFPVTFRSKRLSKVGRSGGEALSAGPALLDSFPLTATFGVQVAELNVD